MKQVTIVTLELLSTREISSCFCSREKTKFVFYIFYFKTILIYCQPIRTCIFKFLINLGRFLT